jgi:hypothetical protein
MRTTSIHLNLLLMPSTLFLMTWNIRMNLGRKIHNFVIRRLLIATGVFRPEPSHTCLLKIVYTYEVFSGKHAWRTQLRLVWLCYRHQSLMWSVWAMSISGLMFNSHLDRTVSLTTLSSKVLTPSDQNSCLENILICMLIVETAENDRHLYYSSLCVTPVCTYSFLNLYIFGAEVYSFST